jgi:hypothetical protein
MLKNGRHLEKLPLVHHPLNNEPTSHTAIILLAHVFL